VSAGRDSFATAGTLTVGDAVYSVHRIADVAPPRLPYSIRILLENLLRHEDGERVTGDQVQALLDWGSAGSFERAVDITPARAFLHDTNGVPAVADLAAVRDASAALGLDPARVNPAIPVELTVDHSVIADVFGRPDALTRNVEFEYARNGERYRFLKWAQSAFRNFRLVPPGMGIMHQINAEYLARVVMVEDGWAYPDLCLGTDSHTTMINGLGVLGWGVGGIEAEAAMLGQSLSMLVPRVIGVRLHGTLPEGATATDLVLTIVERLRRHGVVGTFVEFFGPGVTELPIADRLTIANMSPEFGSTCAYFPIDEETLRYLRFTGRPPEQVALVEAYAKEQGLWHDPQVSPAYSDLVDLSLSAVVPSIAGPRRPQDRVPLAHARVAFREALDSSGGGAGAAPDTGGSGGARPDVTGPVGGGESIRPGSVAIAAITSCTNTSNPSVMVAAGLLARNAVERGLRSKPWVKTSLSPGSRVVTDYYERAGLMPYLAELGFHLAGYGCMTCIGGSGPLVSEVSSAVRNRNVDVVAVLSGNRNFDGRINPEVRMNYLASPPLVVAYAIAGTMDIDLTTEPLGLDAAGRPVHLRDIWPAPREVREVIESTLRPEMFTRAYRDVFAGDARWRALPAGAGERFDWEPDSTYLRRPPYLDGMTDRLEPVTDIRDARVLVKLGDSVTTDHISPAGAIPAHTPAGRYLRDRGVGRGDLNTYASRRGNHEVMMRGTFANVRLRNHLLPGVEGGYTRDLTAGPTASAEPVSIYDAAMTYRAAGIPQLVLAGREYGTGSSRDWAAKGPALLGVRAVLARSFERIHRSNLVGMGILPLEFLNGDSAESLGLTGTEVFHITGLAGADAGAFPERVDVHAGDRSFPVRVRLDTPREVLHYRHGGIMPYLLRELGANHDGSLIHR
jgi:aconitate hydratase